MFSTRHTKFVLLLVFIFVVLLFIKKVYIRKYYFWNSFTGGCYLETTDKLYLLFGINKKREIPWRQPYVPQLCISDTHQILYIIEIHQDGTVQTFSFPLETAMPGFTSSDIHMVKHADEIIILDSNESYLFDNNHITRLGAIAEKELAKTIYEFRAEGKYQSLLEWNNRQRCQEGEIEELFMEPREQNLIWGTYHLKINRSKKENENSKIIITISCLELLSDPIRIIIPLEKTMAYTVPDFKEFPSVISSSGAKNFGGAND